MGKIRKDNKKMKIAIPTSQGKLCQHFGHCEEFVFIEVDENTKKIIK
jgi:predicted Fe-Mo cluster-binding NifX family protein